MSAMAAPLPQDGLASQLPSELFDEVLQKADVPTLLKIKGVSRSWRAGLPALVPLQAISHASTVPAARRSAAVRMSYERDESVKTSAVSAVSGSIVSAVAL